MRVNDSPAEPLYTLIVDGEDVEDLDDWPSAWTKPATPSSFRGARADRRRDERADTPAAPMPDEATLFHQVVTHPDDDAPRRALARLWGGEREAYVTTELAKPTLESLALAERNHRAWAGPIVGRVHAARFLRGFVEWIVVDAAVFARDYETLLALAPIRHLDVTNIGAAAPQFFACPGLAQSVALSFDLGGTPQTHPAGDAIVAPLLASPHMRKLRYLDLRRNDLSEAAHAKLAHATNLPALEVLRLDGLEEEHGMDYDGSIQTVRPSAALVAFEQRHGASAWLHHGERTQREITRTSF